MKFQGNGLWRRMPIGAQKRYGSFCSFRPSFSPFAQGNSGSSAGFSGVFSPSAFAPLHVHGPCRSGCPSGSRGVGRLATSGATVGVNSPVAFGGKSAGACVCASNDVANPTVAIAVSAPFVTRPPLEQELGAKLQLPRGQSGGNAPRRRRDGAGGREDGRVRQLEVHMVQEIERFGAKQNPPAGA